MYGGIEGRRRWATDLHAMAFDIAHAASIANFVRRVVATYPDLDVLTNNDGIMRFVVLDRPRDLAAAEATITMNPLGPMRRTDGLVELLAGRPGAALANMSFALAYVPLTYSPAKAAIHRHTVALREMLRGRVELIELVPPAVQTELTPGQAIRAGYPPLADFLGRRWSVRAPAHAARDPG